MTDAVELRDVFRVFSTPEGDAAALQGLSLGIGEGELVAVLGPSGSGKTTLLRLLAGARPAVGGHRPRVRPRPREAAGAAARLVPHGDARLRRPALRPDARVGADRSRPGRDPLALRGEPRGARDRRADELLERVGLLERRGAHPTELSGGEQQRIAVCAALAHRPRLFLADEPTGELDAENARRCSS